MPQIIDDQVNPPEQHSPDKRWNIAQNFRSQTANRIKTIIVSIRINRFLPPSIAIILNNDHDSHYIKQIQYAQEQQHFYFHPDLRLETRNPFCRFPPAFSGKECKYQKQNTRSQIHKLCCQPIMSGLQVIMHPIETVVILF